jgi:chlorobactene glucosyltransferase
LSSLSVLLAGPWLLPFLALRRLAGRSPNLSDLPPAGGPVVSVIIPARNEAATIETVARSVLSTRYQRMELLVVDDRSTDGTRDAVERLARRDVRLRLIAGEELPPGWFGKQWACFQGYRAARGDVLLFTDADTRHEPDLLGRAIAALDATGADLLTVAPRQASITLWERLVMPQIWVLLGYRFHPSVVNRARRLRDVIANGQFIMMPRASYEAIGTHAAVRGDVAEDLALAQRVWSMGRKLHFAFADRLMETRMYRDLGHLIEGWSKNVYLGGRQSYPDEPLRRALVPFALAGAMLFWLLPPIVLLISHTRPVPVLTGPAVLASIASAGFWSLISYGMQIPVWYGLGYPLGALMTLYIILRSTLRGGRKVEWKERVYNVGRDGGMAGGREVP